MTEVNRQFVIQSPARVEHYAVRSRDWTMIYDSVKVCRPDMPWVSALAWATLGAAIGGSFTVAGLVAAKTTIPFIVGMGVATGALFLLSILSFAVSKGLQKATIDRVDELRKQMDAIRQENDLEAPL